MKQQSKRTPKAYTNLRFLSSPEARGIRILSEFLEPSTRFKAAGIKEAVVFFGSARIVPREVAKGRLLDLKKKLARAASFSQSMQNRISEAELALNMSRYYEDAHKLSSMLTKWALSLDNGHNFVVCSGGGPGIMEAANKGAILAGGKSIGLNISLPHEQESNKYISPHLDFQFHYFFMRKLWFMSLAEAFVMFPGGFGTMDEMMEVLTLLQTKKVSKRIPIVLYGPSYWKEAINFDFMLKYHTISKNDLKIFHFADSPEEAFSILKKEMTRLMKKNR